MYPFFKKLPRLCVLITAVLITFFFQNAAAQSQLVTGKVTDINSREPIIGANINIIGSQTRTVTDAKGEFKINALPNSVLEFKIVGYKTLTAKADVSKYMEINLTAANNNLNDVVVIGYGTAQKRDVTGSISTLKTEKLEKESPRSVQELLRSGIPGLVIGQSTSAKGGGDIQLRGQRSLLANNSPLLVVDGVIFFGELSEINPLDIEQIDVLKDASAASIYGAKAANGVIIISTKKGKTEKPTVRFSANNGFATVASLRKVYDAQGYLQFRQDLYNSSTNRFLNPGKFINPTTENLAAAGITYAQWRAYDKINGTSDEDVWLQRIGLFDNERKNYFSGKTYDWYEGSFQTGLYQDYNLSASGATNNSKTNYYMSLGYLNNKGVVIGDKYHAYRANFKINQEVTNWLSTGANINFQDRSDDNFAVDWEGQIIKNSPFALAKDDNGNLIAQPMGSGNNQGLNSAFNNQYRVLEKGYNVLNTTLYATVKLPFNITLNTNYSPRYQWFYNRYWESAQNPLWSDNGKVDRETQRNFDWQIDNTLNWAGSFGKNHRVKVTLLQNAEEHKSWNDRMTGTDFSPTDALGFHNIGAANLLKSTISTNDTHSTGNALMARVFYSYADRYMLTATVRQDGYSAFGENHPTATFPSLSLAWNFKGEDFLKWEPLSAGKLRLSWGKAGNRSLNDVYQALSNLTTGSGKQPYVTPTGTVYELGQLYVSRMANHDLKWESTASFNAGIDFGFLNNRLTGSIDAYHMPTTDLLVNQNLPDFTGFANVSTNLGEVVNNGLEINLNAVAVKKPNFQWNVNIGFFLNRNKIKHLYYTYTDVMDANGNVTSSTENDDISNGWFIGRDINTIWTYKVLGIWQKGEEAEAAKYGEIPGDVKVLDVDGDGKFTNADKMFQGSRNPRFRWTMRHDFTLFHNLDISMNFYSYIGQKFTTGDFLNTNGIGNSYIRNYWTPENPSTTHARLNSTNVQNIGPNRVLSGSFVRFDNLSLSYLLPQAMVKKLGVNQIRANAGIRNVAFYSPDLEYGDPESSFLPRTFTFGINATF